MALYRRAGEEAQQIDEMARLAENAPSSHRAILRPVVTRNRAGIDGHHERLRLGHALKQRVNLCNLGREATIEADHQDAPVAPSCSIGIFDRLHFRVAHRERLLDEYVFARA